MDFESRGVACLDQRGEEFAPALQQAHLVAGQGLDAAKYPFPGTATGHPASFSLAVKAAWSEMRCQALPVCTRAAWIWKPRT